MPACHVAAKGRVAEESNDDDRADEESEASRDGVLLVAVDRAWCKLVRRPDRSMMSGFGCLKEVRTADGYVHYAKLNLARDSVLDT